MKTFRRIAVVLVAAIAVTLGVQTVVAPEARAELVGVQRVDAQLALVRVHSPALGRTIVNQVLIPRGGGSAPVFYLLNGRSGGIDGDSWLRMTRYRDFFHGKRVTVVSPLGGGYEWYSAGGWERYLRFELPAVMRQHFGANGRNAIAGLSHTAPAALDLAGRSGGLFRAVGSYSGCPTVSNPVGMTAIAATMGIGGGNAFAVLGSPFGPGWTDHDPSLHPHRLWGKAIYLGAGNGIPGPVDGGFSPGLLAGPAEVEVVSLACTTHMANVLNGAGIRNTFHVMPSGAHTWRLFEALMRDSWRVIGPAIGA